MKSLIMAVVAAVLLSGCAGMRQRAAERRADFQRTIPQCSTEKQCSEMWSAAQVWVAKNCRMKIQVATDSIIETYNPVGKHNSTNLAASVTKEPLGDGKYKIVIKTYCNNPFGCVPNSFESAMDFNEYLGSFKR